MIKIVDYGLGNIFAFANVYKALDMPFGVSSTAQDLDNATKIILPGVGSFDKAMQSLNASGMRKVLEEKVLSQSVPVLGICVGMQMLGNESEEGKEQGLGWINGVVRRFDTSIFKQKTHLPHMGWNSIEPQKKNPLLKELDSESRFYFLHSFYFDSSEPESILATTKYGAEFASIVNRTNIYGVQCHPEKSHHFGQQLLRNFAEL